MNGNSFCYIISSMPGLAFKIFASQVSAKRYFIISKIEYFLPFYCSYMFPVKGLSVSLLILLLSCLFLIAFYSLYLESCLRKTFLTTTYKIILPHIFLKVLKLCLSDLSSDLTHLKLFCVFSEVETPFFPT